MSPLRVRYGELFCYDESEYFGKFIAHATYGAFGCARTHKTTRGRGLSSGCVSVCFRLSYQFGLVLSFLGRLFVAVFLRHCADFE